MKSYLESIIKKSLEQYGSLEEEPEIIIEQPRIPEHGDLSTNVAMTLTKVLRKNPRAIAKEIIDNIDFDPQKIKSIEIAGPGFINFRFADQWLIDKLK